MAHEGVLVSVIIPIYDVEPYLSECLDSVCRQSLKDIEIICVDDGSADGSVQILHEYSKRDSRVRVVRQEHQGQSVARNKGLALAEGRYIYFCDSDDYLEPEALQTVCARAERDRLDMAFFNLDVFADETAGKVDSRRILDEAGYFRRSGAYPGIMGGSEFFCLLRRQDEYTCTVCQYLLRREFLLGTGVKFYPGIIHEDELFTLQCLLRATRVGYLPQVFYHRRMRRGSDILSKVGIEDVRGCLLAAVMNIKGLRGEYTAAEQEAVAEYLLSCLRVGRNRYRSLPEQEQRKVREWPMAEQLLFRLVMQGEVLRPEMERLQEACRAAQAGKELPGQEGLLIYGVGAHLYDVLESQPELARQASRIFDKDRQKLGTFVAGIGSPVEAPTSLAELEAGTVVYISAIRYFDAIAADIAAINGGIVCKSIDELCGERCGHNFRENS